MASLGERMAVISIVSQSNDCVPEGQSWEGVIGPVYKGGLRGASSPQGKEAWSLRNK